MIPFTFSLLFAQQSFSGAVVAVGGGSFCEIFAPRDRQNCYEKLAVIQEQKQKFLMTRSKLPTSVYRREFAFMAQLAVQQLRGRLSEKEKEIEALNQSFELSSIFLDDELFFNSDYEFELDPELTDEHGHPLTAINIKDQDRKKIVINPLIWESANFLSTHFSHPMTAKMIIALHEFLSLLSIESSNVYTISSLLARIPSGSYNLSSQEFKEIMKMTFKELLCETETCPLEGINVSLLRDLNPRKIHDHLARYSSFPLPFVDDFVSSFKEVEKTHISLTRDWFNHFAQAISRSFYRPSRTAQLIRSKVEELESNHRQSCRFHSSDTKRLSSTVSAFREKIYEYTYLCTDRESFETSRWQFVLQFNRENVSNLKYRKF